MAEDRERRLMQLQKKASKLRDSENQAKLIEEMLELLEEIQRDIKNEEDPS
jgi:23S rRNA maturation mini-RNase III